MFLSESRYWTDPYPVDTAALSRGTVSGRAVVDRQTIHIMTSMLNLKPIPRYR